MVAEKQWVPRKSDIAWTEKLLDSLKDNGTWAVPMNSSVFQFNKVQKTYRLLLGDPLEETNSMIVQVLGVLGYTHDQEDYTS